MKDVELCPSCLRSMISHSLGRCPGPGLHVTLDSLTVERARATGHPKLVRAVICVPPEERSALKGVSITRFRVRTMREFEEIDFKEWSTLVNLYGRWHREGGVHNL